MAQVVTSWKRIALEEFDYTAVDGLCADMKAVCRGCFLDHGRISCVDRWD